MIEIDKAIENIELISGYTVERFETTSEFLIYATITNPDRFKRYCEVVICRDGSIVVPINSAHMYIMQYLTGYSREELMSLDNTSKEVQYYNEWLFERTESCAVWYEFQKLSKNCFENQKILDSLDALEKAGLIIKNLIPVNCLADYDFY